MPLIRTIRIGKVFAGLAVVLLLGAVAGVVWFLLWNTNTRVANAIVGHDSRATGARVRVDAASVELKEGSAGIRRLAVANPEGFARQPAIALENIEIQLDPLAATSDPLVIDTVAVDGARLLIEQSGTRNNLRTLLASIEQQAGEGHEGETEGRLLVIERFEVENVTAVLYVADIDQEWPVASPGIVLTGIGCAGDGQTAGAVAQQVLGPLIREALESVTAEDAGDMAAIARE